MKNHELADLFDRMATLLEIKGEIIFKVRAYSKAAENIRNLAEDIADIRAEGRLDEIPGIGKTLQEKIGEYLDTGRLAAYENLIKEIPATLLEVVQIPSVGPKKAKLFFEERKIKDVDGLYSAAADGSLLKLPGIREKTIENILSGIKVVRAGQERMNLGTATHAAEEIIAALKPLKEVRRIEPGGSLRRCRETIRDIDLLVVSSHPQKVMEAFIKLPMVKQVNAHGETKSSVLTTDNLQVDLRVVEEESFGAALLYFTGSKEFNVRLRQLAIKKNMKVNEYGIFRVAGKAERRVAGKTEEECFKALGLPYIPPEIREEIGAEIIFESPKSIPSLIEVKDIRGELHVHSTYSDGHNSIAEMARVAEERGYEYLAVSDHSERLRVAGGVSPEDLKKKKAEIDKLNAANPKFRILFGTELEIDSDGNLDYNNKILNEFDFVIAAIHSGFEQSRDKLTKRLVKACRSKYVHAIAHPTGVHLGRREPYDIDFKEVCRAAVDTNTFLEINGFPIRLDLNSANVYYARSQGVKFVIDTDAHAVEHLGHMRFGVSIARRGWLAKEDVVNTRTLKDMLKMLKKS